MNLIERAVAFATSAHEAVGQRRKYTDEPYMVHPLEVMDLLRKHATCPVTDEMLAAAALHDVAEDTDVSLDAIRQEFGDAVYHLVENLTDVSHPEDGNRRARKQKDLEHTQHASPEAKSIKCCDLISNASSIVENDPGFARVWLREKTALLEVLSDADPGVYAEAVRVHKESMEKLNRKN
jgi:(p)ppGpp synthase/HD superfamily hydrolase